MEATQATEEPSIIPRGSESIKCPYCGTELKTKKTADQHIVERASCDGARSLGREKVELLKKEYQDAQAKAKTAKKNDTRFSRRTVLCGCGSSHRACNHKEHTKAACHRSWVSVVARELAAELLSSFLEHCLAPDTKLCVSNAIEEARDSDACATLEASIKRLQEEERVTALLRKVVLAGMFAYRSRGRRKKEMQPILDRIDSVCKMWKEFEREPEQSEKARALQKPDEEEKSPTPKEQPTDEEDPRIEMIRRHIAQSSALLAAGADPWKKLEPVKKRKAPEESPKPNNLVFGLYSKETWLTFSGGQRTAVRKILTEPLHPRSARMKGEIATETDYFDSIIKDRRRKEKQCERRARYLAKVKERIEESERNQRVKDPYLI